MRDIVAFTGVGVAFPAVSFFEEPTPSCAKRSLTWTRTNSAACSPGSRGATSTAWWSPKSGAAATAMFGRFALAS